MYHAPSFLAAAIFSLTGLFVSSSGVAGERLKIFILAGQSNMAGSGVPEELPAEYREHPKNVRMPIPPRDRGRRPATDLVPFAPLPERFGPEVAFAHAIGRAWPNERIVLIKMAIGGTSALAWAPDWTSEGAALTENERVGALYGKLVNRQVKPILDRYGKEAKVAGILWAQGGRDGRFEKAAETYEANLTKIINAFRRDLGDSKLPFVFAHTVDAPMTGFPYIEQVRAAQKRVAEPVPRTALVPIDGLSRKRDRTHFDTQGQLELGRRFADAYLKLVGEER
jgi:hypothetical protein